MHDSQCQIGFWIELGELPVASRFEMRLRGGACALALGASDIHLRYCMSRLMAQLGSLGMDRKVSVGCCPFIHSVVAFDFDPLS